MSQTYERTQPDPCDHDQTADCDDVELSLRRSQHYLASGPTQHYSKHDHDLLLVTAAAAALANHAAAAYATSTAADAWEASIAEASALGGGASAATLLPPPTYTLEGQDSNGPGNLDGPAAAIAGVQDLRELSFVLKPLGLQRRLQRPEQTPELQVPGVSCGTAGSGSACTAATAEDVADDGTTPTMQVGMPLFPIFTQGRGRRRPPIHLIRHGESEYNLACKRRGGFHDPSDIFDARLTAHGTKQARELRPQLFDLMQKYGDPLFIVSPLSRAIETFLHMLPDPARLRVIPTTPPPGQQLAAGTGSARPSRLQPHLEDGKEQHPAGWEAGSSCGLGGLVDKPINMMVCPILSEFLQTSGDVGRPRSVLLKEYPQIAEQLRKGLDKERWWYENLSRGPNCAISRTLSSTEPDKVAKARVDRFRSFVFSQPHRPVVVVGHANFFKTLMNDSHYMGNCQMTAWAPP